MGIHAGNVFSLNIARDVHPIKTRGIKPLHFGVERAYGFFHAVHVLVNERITPNNLADLFHGAAMSHQFVHGRHVYAVHIGVAHGRGGTGQVHLTGTSVTRHLHDFLTGGATHDGVVHQQHIAVFKFADDHIQFLTH